MELAQKLVLDLERKFNGKTSFELVLPFFGYLKSPLPLSFSLCVCLSLSISPFCNIWCILWFNLVKLLKTHNSTISWILSVAYCSSLSSFPFALLILFSLFLLCKEMNHEIRINIAFDFFIPKLSVKLCMSAMFVTYYLFIWKHESKLATRIS